FELVEHLREPEHAELVQPLAAELEQVIEHLLRARSASDHRQITPATTSFWADWHGRTPRTGTHFRAVLARVCGEALLPRGVAVPRSSTAVAIRSSPMPRDPLSSTASPGLISRA